MGSRTPNLIIIKYTHIAEQIWVSGYILLTDFVKVYDAKVKNPFQTFGSSLTLTGPRARASTSNDQTTHHRSNHLVAEYIELGF